MLEEIGLIFSEINQDNLHEGCFGKNFSSPTLVVDNDFALVARQTHQKVLVLQTYLISMN